MNNGNSRKEIQQFVGEVLNACIHEYYKIHS